MCKGKQWLKDEINVLYRKVALGELEFNEQWVLKHMLDLVDQIEEPEKRADDALYNIAGLMTDYENAGTLNEVDLIREIHNELMSFYHPKEKRYRVNVDGLAILASFYGEVGLYHDSVLRDEDYVKELTEQEIKEYDERFWPFAEEVTE